MKIGKIVSLLPLENYQIEVKFDNGIKKNSKFKLISEYSSLPASSDGGERLTNGDMRS